MQNSRHSIRDIDEIFLQAGGTKPNCSPLGDGPIEDAAALSRYDRSVTANIDANFGIRLRVFPGDDAVTVGPKRCGQARLASIG
jgi:hypothetical protein